ncbi:MAG: hypothetical protein JKX80_00945 [Candidatus Pacebacteria bacterium]|nr:hypothetical protein [Candidatus Paceibacterota bacterium]
MPFPKVSGTHYYGIPHWVIASSILALLFVLGITVYPPLLLTVLTWLFILSPIWAPLTLFGIWWSQWIKYTRAKFIAGQVPILLEIKIPRQIFKTPRAMELVFAGLNVGPGETTFISTMWEGKVRPWWSLEMVSIEGKIYFYIWAWEQYREFIESQFYAQYPDIEIHEVEDYSQGVRSDPKVNKIWSMEFALSKPDAYPIKTYIDFELDQDAKKVEQVVDPISGVFEKLSSLGPGEQLWIQILIRQNKGSTTERSFLSTPVTWKDEATAEIEKIYKDATPQEVDLATGDTSEGKYPLLKPGEVNTIKALERSLEKPGFDTGIRVVYITKPDSFKGHKIPTDIVSLWNTFGSGTLNKFVPGSNWHVSLDFPWEDFRGMRVAGFSRNVLDAYQRRSLFHPPYEHPRFVLTTEELATIYHFPTEETKAPGIERIPSTKGEAPTNLPT